MNPQPIKLKTNGVNPGESETERMSKITPTK
jgi:hypothetical protein